MYLPLQIYVTIRTNLHRLKDCIDDFSTHINIVIDYINIVIDYINHQYVSSLKLSVEFRISTDFHGQLIFRNNINL